ncbi:MAG: hydrogenase maturation protease [Promethearchaeota archaeon]
MLEKLKNMLKGATKVVFMGIGEEKMADDGVGPYIISELLKYSNEKILFVNAGIDPMTRIEEIIKFHPSHLILIDTCTFNGPPGTVAILKRKNICNYVPISTHTIPIYIVIDFIIEKLPRSNLKVFMIGIVPESLKGFTELTQYKAGELSLEELSENENLPFFNFNLTETIKKVADKLILILKEIIQIL